jgi:hypothetical protein
VEPKGAHVGQAIEVHSTIHGDVAVFDTDRTFTGQDGRGFTRAEPDGGFEGLLAKRLLDSDPAVDHVFVQFNVISVRRHGGWDDGSIRRAGEQITDFFLVY